MARRRTPPAAFRQCGPIRTSGFARRGEGRRTAPDGLVRAHRKGGTGGIARAGRIFEPGHGQASAPAVPAPPRHVHTGSAGILAGSFLKPAGWKPAPHGAPGFHAFVETTAIRAPQRVTRRAEKRSAFRQTHTPNLIPLRSPAASSTTSSPPQSGEIHPLHDPTVERGARPIRLLHRIDVDVIHMGRVVLLVADRMFPESPLPDAALALGGADRRSPFGPRQGLGEGDLDRLPAGRVVRVIGWHVQTACIWSGNMTQARCGRDGRRAPS